MQDSIKKIFFGILSLLLLIFIQTLVYSSIEGWDLFTSFYVSVITISTVGYGDFVPKTFLGRVVTIIYIFVGVGLVAYTLSNVASFLIEGHFKKIFKMRKMIEKIKKLKDHYIVCGYGRLGRVVVDELKKSNIPYVVIDINEDVLKEAVEMDNDLICIVGDATLEETLEKANIRKAKGLISVVGSDAENVFITLTAKSLNPNIFVVAKADKSSTLDKLIKAGADRAICPYIVGGMEIAKIAINPEILEFIHSLVANEEDMEVRRLTIKNEALDGKTLRESKIREKTGATILAIKKGNKMITSPPPEVKLNVGDVVYAFGKREQLEKLSKYLEG
ncbi:TrkA-N domain-containing protein [Methanocaldococcus villosus KIN24-T80]|uniref:TrkA-N domain-containing protein n=1 Tax=Methanocaldococcus villosus KIN24-T80 TaxID=1069083 RepID=N6VXX9_9EURY|nr:potassium channel protein [Methanocaldococcus villosus]ENN95992.1 TrkA-N domain-containing protein [Methanocaldococcus villosus KIN24-T80]